MGRKIEGVYISEPGRGNTEESIAGCIDSGELIACAWTCYGLTRPDGATSDEKTIPALPDQLETRHRGCALPVLSRAGTLSPS